MFSLFLRNIFFTIVHPGLVAGLFPFWILGDKTYEEIAEPFEFHKYIAIVIFLIGLTILLSCIIRFAVEGRGTLSPADPTKRLVIKGLYKYSRNPMYVGLTALLVGWAIWLSAPWVFLGPIALMLYLTRFQIIPEERVMSAKFGRDYDDYRKRVRRWL